MSQLLGTRRRRAKNRRRREGRPLLARNSRPRPTRAPQRPPHPRRPLPLAAGASPTGHPILGRRPCSRHWRGSRRTTADAVSLRRHLPRSRPTGSWSQDPSTGPGPPRWPIGKTLSWWPMRTQRGSTPDGSKRSSPTRGLDGRDDDGGSVGGDRWFISNPAYLGPQAPHPCIAPKI